MLAVVGRYLVSFTGKGVVTATSERIPNRRMHTAAAGSRKRAGC